MAKKVTIQPDDAMELTAACSAFFICKPASGYDPSIQRCLLHFINVMDTRLPGWRDNADAQRFMSANMTLQSFRRIYKSTSFMLDGHVPPTRYEADMSYPHTIPTLFAESTEAWLLGSKDKNLKDLCDFSRICRKFAASPVLAGDKFENMRDRLHDIATEFQSSELEEALARVVKPKIPLLAAARHGDGAAEILQR